MPGGISSMPPDPKIPPLFTVQQAAEKLNISPALMYRIVSHQEIEHIRVGIGRGAIRFTEVQIDNYKNSRKRGSC
jgi:excisionase family DNA binding protein